MPISIPISRGIGRSSKDIQYIDLLPVNFLAVPKDVLDSPGYMRTYPGVVLDREIEGVSRGVIFNSKMNEVYRVIGTGLYRGADKVGDVPLDVTVADRVKMAFSATTQAVATGGLARMYNYVSGAVSVLDNWPSSTGYGQYTIGYVNDIVRNRGRYIWSQRDSQLFGVTDIENETHPDRNRPFYSAESQPDGILCIDSWRDFVVCFGASTIEYFALTGASSTTSPIYASQPSLMVNVGVAGRFAKCKYMDSFALLSGSSTGEPGVYVVGTGSASRISTKTVEMMIGKYTKQQLEGVIMESFRFRGHELLVVHLPQETLCYDATGGEQGAPTWSIIKTGTGNLPHRSIDYMFNGNAVEVADKSGGVIGLLSDEVFSQYGEQQEAVLFSPMLAGNGITLHDLQIESGTGNRGQVQKLMLSVTVDGINYGKEISTMGGKPYEYNKRVIMRRIGYVRKNIGFKIRAVSESPLTLSNLTVRPG